MDLFRILRKKEEDLLARIINYTILVGKTVEKLKELIELLIKKEGKRKITSIFSEIDMLETEADEVRRKLTEEIAAGSFFSYLREDFLLLLETIDDIADSAKDASKILIESKLNEESILFLFHNSGGIRYVDSLLNTVRMLIKCLESLRKVPPKKLISLVRSVELSEENFRQILIPVGFAHGFSVLSDEAEVQYKVTSYYNPQLERSISLSDEEIGVDWQVEKPLISERDKKAL